MARVAAIPFLSPVLRRVSCFRAVMAGAASVPANTGDFARTITDYRREAMRNRHSPSRVVAGLWNTEGCAAIVGRLGLGGRCELARHPLRDERIPPECQPVCHIGFGTASAEYAAFDLTKLSEVLLSQCHPDYRRFYYEGVGAALRIFQPGVLNSLFCLLRVASRGAPCPNESDFFRDFISAFDRETQQMIAHGYGRLLAVSHTSLSSAVAEALSFPPERHTDCIRGIGFAWALLNSADLASLITIGCASFDPVVRNAFREGLTNALVFCDWFVPGFLSSWNPQGGIEEEFIDRALRECARNVRRGYLIPFFVNSGI